LSAFTFSMYTVKEFATLKTRIHNLEERQVSLMQELNMDYPNRESMEDSRSTLHSNKVIY
jgi:hypothetical protein